MRISSSCVLPVRTLSQSCLDRCSGKGPGLATCAGCVAQSRNSSACRGGISRSRQSGLSLASPSFIETLTMMLQAAAGGRQRPPRLELVPVIPWAPFLLLALLGTACGFAFLLIAHPQAPALRWEPGHISWTALGSKRSATSHHGPGWRA